ncbi:MAG: PIG-L deacetylase family protein [Anaerolineales bacterium]
MITSNRRLLASLAHPDDESFGPGGTLALYAQRGVDVHLICATRGDVGTVDPEYLKGFDDVAELRLAELDCAVQALGIHQLHQLNYRDSGMPGTADNQHKDALAAAPIEEVVGKIVEVIRRVRPQVVLTFDPIGGYFHPDHIRMHEATVEAFHAAGDSSRFPGDGAPYQPQKLYYHTFSRRWLKWLVRLMPVLRMDPSHWGRNNDIDLTALTEHDFPVNASIDVRPVTQAKQMATACHASQTDEDGTAGFFLNWLRRLGGEHDTYVRAIPEGDPGRVEHDLFAGVDVEPDST